MKVVFLGSPQYAIAPLEFLLRADFCELVGVISQPAQRTGRGRRMQDPPVAVYAKENNLLVLQPHRASAGDFLDALRDLNPDICITCAYGQILSDNFLGIPKRATINIHPSLLPKYRGATPVQTSLKNGDKQTGVSLLFTVKELDSGNIILQQQENINPLDTAEELLPRLFQLSCKLLRPGFELLSDKKFCGSKQELSEVTYCSKITKDQGRITWSSKADEIINSYRAYKIWPGSYTFFHKKRLQLAEFIPIDKKSLDVSLDYGEFLYLKSLDCLCVAAEGGCIGVNKIKPEAKKWISAKDFWNSLDKKNLNIQKFD
jgi:methionyl-tRNA formyltransferase